MKLTQKLDSNWFFCQNDVQDAFRADFDHSSWQEISDAAAIERPRQMIGNSLLSLLNGSTSNSTKREEVYMGRECHDCGREGDVGYPVRCIRTKEHLYVHNYASDRWPAGNPETFFTNCDGSPTKDLIIDMNEYGNDYYYNLAFGKRPEEELYLIKEDPECLDNLEYKCEYQDIKNELRIRLDRYLEETKDPRFFGNGEIFDNYVIEKFSKEKNSWAAYIRGEWELPDYMNWKKI